MANKSSGTVSVKFILTSTGVVFVALLLSLSLLHLLSSAPNIWSSFRGWLKPPYLYVIINGIIITIAASSRLQHKRLDHPSTYDQHLHHHHQAVKGSSLPVPVPASVPTIPGNQHLHDHHYYPAPPLVMPERVMIMSSGAEKYESDHQYGAFLIKDVVNRVKETTIREETVGAHEAVKEQVVADAASFQNRRDGFVGGFVDDLKRRGVIGGKDAVDEEEKPKRTPLEKQDSIAELLAKVAERPPVSASARFGHHRKPVRAGMEGGKALRVLKPKKQETLETTWKAITAGRHMPLTRHLKMSDSWENHLDSTSPPPPPRAVKKSETFHERTNYTSPTATPTVCPGKLKKEPSLSQDELNRRVEAFINKFNEDMRLQRQQSIQQFMERINPAL